MMWLAVALAAQAFASLAVCIDKVLLDGHSPPVRTLVGVASTVGCAFGAAVWIIGGRPTIFGTAWFHALGAGVLNVAYLVPYLQALKLGHADRVVPLFQSVPVFTLVLAAVCLGETLRGQEYVGFVACSRAA